MCQLKIVSTEGFTPTLCGQFVDRIDSIRLLADGSECEEMQKPNKTLVAATFEKTKTYVFAEPLIRDREVSDSGFSSAYYSIEERC